MQRRRLRSHAEGCPEFFQELADTWNYREERYERFEGRRRQVHKLIYKVHETRLQRIAV
jgi:hypothetical protein